MRYFTNSPFERLMMEKPCGQSKAADVAWREYEDNERKKRRCVDKLWTSMLRTRRNLLTDWG